MKMLIAGFAALVLLTGEQRAGAVTVTLDMSQDPATLGWSVANNGGSHSVSDGVLTVDAPNYYEFDAPPSLWDDTVNNDAGWSVETRVRLTSFIEEYSDIGGLHLWIHAIGNYAKLDIFPNKIRLRYPDFVEHTMNTMDDFHTYRVEGREDRVKVYADSILVMDVTGTVTGGTQTLYFGDGANANPTTSQWDYFTFTTYLPEAHWVGESGGEWDTPENWESSHSPTHIDDVFIQPDIGLTVIGSQSAQTIKSLTLGAESGGTTTLELQGTGTLNVTERTTTAGLGRLSGEGTLNAAGGIDNHGEIDLGAGNLQLVGGTLANYGVIRGEGRIDNTLSNDGEIWGHPGKLLVFTGSGNINSGEINLVGGNVRFDLDLTNTSDGFISGRGVLAVGSELINDGTMAFSGGYTDVYGDVTNNADAKVVVSGGSTTTFYDHVHSDGEIRISINSGAVFFGELSGEGPMTGPGTAYIEGDLRPGNSTAEITFGGDLVFGSTAGLEIELDGPEHDQLTVAGNVYLDGTLSVQPINDLGPVGETTRTIIQTAEADSIMGDFAVKPALREYLDYGVFFRGTDKTDNAYTLNLFQAGPGDFDGDGDVDLDDLSLLDDGWDPAVIDKIWTDGDGDGDGDVDLDDLSLLDDHWAPAGYPVVNCPLGGGGGLGAAPVPEPGTLMLLGMGLGGLLAYTWRKRRRR